MYKFTEADVSPLSAPWVQDPTEAQRGQSRLANVVFPPVLRKLSVHHPVSDPVQTHREVVRTRLGHRVSNGVTLPQARVSKRAPQEAGETGAPRQTDHRQADSEHKHQYV